VLYVGVAAPGWPGYHRPMKQSQRKLVGMFACVAFLTVYSLAAMALGGQFVVGGHRALELGFYALAGFLWLPPVMVIVRWMSKPDAA
jgi:Protein of unknown function (DUF2842)